MADFKSSFYLPQKFFKDPTTVDFMQTNTNILDQSLQLAFFSEINKLKNLYNPSSEYYDTDYILDLLGQNTLKNLLSDVTDRTSLTMILTGMENIKGTKKAFYAMLKLLNIQYETIIFNVLPTGCTEITIVFAQGQRIDLNSIALLDKFSQEVFPLCISLVGITNCTAYNVSGVYNGFNTVNLGMHHLDIDFILDMSKMDTGYGVLDTSISNSIFLLICNSTVSDFNFSTPLVDSLLGINTTSYLNYGRGSQILLDRNLILDMFNPADYYGFDVSSGALYDNEQIYTNNILAQSNVFGDSKLIFRLDITPMDVSVFQPMDGIPSVITSVNSLDSGFNLDSTLLDTANKVVTYITNPIMRNYTADTAIVESLYFDNSIYSIKTRLDFEYPSTSNYLPLLNI